MRILVLSDVHGNLPALEFVLKTAEDIDLLISLGDVVNYGPWSNECVQLLDTLPNKVLLSGNHEVAYLNGSYTGKNEIAQLFFKTCFPGFNQLSIVEKYIESYRTDDYLYIHTLNNAYIFPDTEIDLAQNTFIGHSHKQFERVIDKFKLVNVGSVGQNRTNIDLLNYVIFDTDTKKNELVTKFFNNDLLISQMKQLKYPEICINYIQGKRKS